MPKTVDKRAQARRTARVQQAHQTAPEQTGAKRSAASRKRKQKTGLVGFIQRFPLASTLIAIAVVGGAVLLMASLRLGPWYVAPPPLCNLKTHECQPNAWKSQAFDPT
jgi:Flp pilus assembly protein TadB